ncbi:hypothetical protein NDU88_005925 [Pleurodeles waltl]|uniref:RNase H type-1 domain-containing protein n=1 Tax=Pleurodeles waltl TaxID=8319 RepID=A0AAV7WWN3_PLEWA|nr:hypothetical protein NDU88_005925 [Pleurodeles waltl]
MVGYCCQWIPNFSIISKPLIKLTGKEIKDEPYTIALSKEELESFRELRECMCGAPALGMPDYTKPFLLFCHERDACSLSVLTQVHGGANRPVAYFSATLDPVAAALTGCLRAVAAVGQSLTQCEGIVMGYPLTVMVPHSVEILLTRTKTQHMTNARLTKYETIILGSPNVSLKRCTALNPVTLLPAENTEVNNEEEVEHDCLEVTELCTKPRPDIQHTQLEENDCIMFVDGSCLRDSVGMLRAGYAVCTIAGIIEASWLERVYSAQVAELIALTKACHAAENLRVTIYTDSRYGFGIVHDFGHLWLQRGFMTSSDSPVKNGEQIKDLLHAIQLPLEIAVVKCNAHVKSQDFVSMGNGYADQVARFCALNCISFKDQWELMPQTENDTCLNLALRVVDTLDELKTLQGRASKEEKCSWQRMQCVQRADDLWISEEGKLVLPNSLLSQFARLYNGQAHLGRDAMIRSCKIHWFNPKFRHAAEVTCHRCIICQQMNARKGTVVTLSHIGRAGGPFSKMQMDFIEMPVCGGLKYVLVIKLTHCHRSVILVTPYKPVTGLVVKKHVRKSCLEPRWKGPYQVILTTTTTVKCAGVPNWIHASHTKKVTCPSDEELEVSGTTVTEREVSGLENSQERTETAGEPTENSLVPQTVNKFERGDSVPISVEAAGELNQGEVLPEVDGYGLELEPVTDPEEEEEEGEIIERDHSTPATLEPVAGPSRENTIVQEEGAVQRPERTGRKKTHKGDNWPEKQDAREKSVPGETITEETDTSRVEDLSEGELQGDRRLKRKRNANRRYAGPEWAYATTSEWQQEFLAFCFDRAVPGQYYGT